MLLQTKDKSFYIFEMFFFSLSYFFLMIKSVYGHKLKYKDIRRTYDKKISNLSLEIYVLFLVLPKLNCFLSAF